MGAGSEPSRVQGDAAGRGVGEGEAGSGVGGGATLPEGLSVSPIVPHAELSSLH